MVAFATEYAPKIEAPDAENRARGIFLAVEVRAGENGARSRHPRREKVAFSYETASGPTNFLNRDPMNEHGGINLYAFIANNPVNDFDFLGLTVSGSSRSTPPLPCHPDLFLLPNPPEECIPDVICPGGCGPVPPPPPPPAPVPPPSPPPPDNGGTGPGACPTICQDRCGQIAMTCNPWVKRWAEPACLACCASGVDADLCVNTFRAQCGFIPPVRRGPR